MNREGHPQVRLYCMQTPSQPQQLPNGTRIRLPKVYLSKLAFVGISLDLLWAQVLQEGVLEHKLAEEFEQNLDCKDLGHIHLAEGAGHIVVEEDIGRTLVVVRIVEEGIQVLVEGILAVVEDILVVVDIVGEHSFVGEVDILVVVLEEYILSLVLAHHQSLLLLQMLKERDALRREQ